MVGLLFCFFLLGSGWIAEGDDLLDAFAQFIHVYFAGFLLAKASNPIMLCYVVSLFVFCTKFISPGKSVAEYGGSRIW